MLLRLTLAAVAVRHWRDLKDSCLALEVGEGASADTSLDHHEKSLAAELSRSPMIRPNSPRTDEKISTTRILTKLFDFSQ